MNRPEPDFWVPGVRHRHEVPPHRPGLAYGQQRLKAASSSHSLLTACRTL